MINRLFVEKKSEFNAPARNLFNDLSESLHIPELKSLRIIQRYDVEGLNEDEFDRAARLILSEPQIDLTSKTLSITSNETAFAVEYLPGQFDQRADSAAQCVEILTQGKRPKVASAQVIVLEGALSDSDITAIKNFTINKVDSREASMDPPTTLEIKSKSPEDVAILIGFGANSKEELSALRKDLGLAMSLEDLLFCQGYFRDEENREPTITEIRMLDTYWSDHCRHTTFLTKIDKVTFEPNTEVIEETYHSYLATRDKVYGVDTERPVTLMDIALIGMKELRKSGELDNLEESEEINAASIVVPVDVDGKDEEWLVMFKNETHNHPTEIEPFGGAATCLGGAIRDPLSGRSYVYQAMRVTGAGDPRTPFEDTLPGKLPQRKICRVAADGYSSYGNQIGLATGQVAEVYHPGYVAKRMEIGAVVSAAPRENVFRGTAEPGDAILLIGGRTGRDGVGGATGSSKEHDQSALENSAEVQKGNPPTERKIQRLFRNPDFAKKVKVCNDFGAGGVSVAIGELAPSLEINLDKVPKKYEGLDGTELAISESQERMAIVIDKSNIAHFIKLSDEENLECVHVANVTDSGRLQINWRGKTIVDLNRTFLDTNGVQLTSTINVTSIPSSGNPLGSTINAVTEKSNVKDKLLALLSDLSQGSQKGLNEQFDSSIGAGTVLSPFGGKHQLTPTDAMVAKVPLLKGETTTCTHMSWGFNPRIASWSPFHSAAYAITNSVCKIVSSGAKLSDIRLTLQEYFEKLGDNPSRWGKPFSALLGAYLAQTKLRIGAIGGKDSMSGSFKDLDVPPTLVSFAVAPGKTSTVLSPEFKNAGNKLSLVSIKRDSNNLPDFDHLKEVADIIHNLASSGALKSAHTLGDGGIAAGLAKMSFGNKLGAVIAFDEDALFTERHAHFIIESAEELPASLNANLLGETSEEPVFHINNEKILVDELYQAWAEPLESVYPTQASSSHPEVDTFTSDKTPSKRSSSTTAQQKPKVIIPVFPGNNCEYDTAKQFSAAGADVETFIFRNLSSQAVAESLKELADHIRNSQILMIPGGFSAGDEPDGSGKFIATVLRNPEVADAVMDLLKNRDGLTMGICNGFQALIKTGLLPYGEIRDPEANAPTLSFNDIGRHVSCYVTTRISSTLSPWLAHNKVGDLHQIPVSHGEGKFFASEAEIRQLAANGQIATQYTDLTGNPSMDIAYNPNGSLFAIEGISSPDGRVFGKMGHSERLSDSVAKNIPGDKDQMLFKAGVDYFS